MIKYKTPLVECIWHDAATTFGWEHEDECDVEEELMVTVGFVVAKGEHTIIIASSIDQETSRMNNARIKIPVGMIKSIRELNVAYKKEKKEVVKENDPVV